MIEKFILQTNKNSSSNIKLCINSYTDITINSRPPHALYYHTSKPNERQYLIVNDKHIHPKQCYYYIIYSIYKQTKKILQIIYSAKSNSANKTLWFRAYAFCFLLLVFYLCSVQNKYVLYKFQYNRRVFAFIFFNFKNLQPKSQTLFTTTRKRVKYLFISLYQTNKTKWQA